MAEKERRVARSFDDLPQAGKEVVMEVDYDDVIYEFPVKRLSKSEWEMVELDADIPPINPPPLAVRGGNVPNKDDEKYKIERDLRLDKVRMRRLAKAMLMPIPGGDYREQADYMLSTRAPGILEAMYTALMALHWEGTARIKDTPRHFREAGEAEEQGDDSAGDDV